MMNPVAEGCTYGVNVWIDGVRYAKGCLYQTLLDGLFDFFNFDLTEAFNLEQGSSGRGMDRL